MAGARQLEAGTLIRPAAFEEAAMRRSQQYDAAHFLRSFLQLAEMPPSLQQPTEGINPEVEMLDLLNGASTVRRTEPTFQERFFVEQGLPRVTVIAYEEAGEHTMHVLVDPQAEQRGNHALFGYDPAMGDWQLVDAELPYIHPDQLAENYSRDGLDAQFRVVYNPPLYLVK